MNETGIVPGIEGLAAQTGYEIAEYNGVAMLVISADNSYYNEENIRKQIECCAKNFSKTYVMIPQDPLEHNYLSLDYSFKDAQRKARLKCNSLRNKAQRGIEGLVENQSEFHLIDWKEEISNNALYLENLCYFNELYRTNKSFRNDVGEVVAGVLGKASSEGKNYVLKEFAMIFATPVIFNEKKIAVAYHKKWDLFQAYVSGKYGKENKEVGFVVVD